MIGVIKVYKKDLGNGGSEVYFDIVKKNKSYITSSDVLANGLNEEKKEKLKAAFPPTHVFWKEILSGDADEKKCNAIISTGCNEPLGKLGKLKELIKEYNRDKNKVEHTLFRFDVDTSSPEEIRGEEAKKQLVALIDNHDEKLQFLGEKENFGGPRDVISFVRECLSEAEGVYIVAFCQKCQKHTVFTMKKDVALCHCCRERCDKEKLIDSSYNGKSYYQATKKASEQNSAIKKEKEAVNESFYFLGKSYPLDKHGELFDALYKNLSSGKDAVFSARDQYGNLTLKDSFSSYLEGVRKRGFEGLYNEINEVINTGNSNGYDEVDAMYALFVGKGLLSRKTVDDYKGKIRAFRDGKLIDINSLKEYLSFLKNALIEKDGESIRFYLSLIKEPYIGPFFENRVSDFNRFYDIAKVFYEERKEFLYFNETSDGFTYLYERDYRSFLERGLDESFTRDVFDYYSSVVMNNKDSFQDIKTLDASRVSDPYLFLAVLLAEVRGDGLFRYRDFEIKEINAKEEMARLFEKRYQAINKKAEEDKELSSFIDFVKAAKNEMSTSSIYPEWVEDYLDYDLDADETGLLSYLKSTELGLDEAKVIINREYKTFREHFEDASSKGKAIDFVEKALPILKIAFEAKNYNYDAIYKKVSSDFDALEEHVKDIVDEQKKGQ